MVNGGGRGVKGVSQAATGHTGAVGRKGIMGDGRRTGDSYRSNIPEPVGGMKS